ncbi:hypothetical protein ASE92_09080 [Pedobacter sp. Leaf41]|uniref:DUF4998 domain-containing protein n=1 Tax=Pedobacter sp. Leaf41 TaxID=1736218 RepID=UPI000702992B|nr:DUF4998 domain-containing protein [Pedobacter sp. Leaf41]KQN36264.1 hypothetical protein ASE92_09080 [Pedobacter sp. Leaf41]
MRKIYQLPAFLFLLTIVVSSCTKDDLAFKEYLKNGETVYPGKVSKIVAKAGNLRTGLWFNPSPDPSVTKYVIKWNNNVDSIAVNSSSHNPLDTIKVIIPGLSEYTYTFTVFSYDAQGRKSIPIEAPNVRVYGPLYQSGLLNRPFNATEPYVVNANGSVQLNFNTPDTINVGTTIRYTNTANVQVDKVLSATEMSTVLNDYKSGTDILYRSSYIPSKGSLDVFNASEFSTFPKIFTLVQCDKSLFKEIRLPNDVNTYESGTSISKLWDGSNGPQSYPNIFHSDGSYIAHVLTFDMGKTYTNLAQMEEVGRDCCNNPDRFEVWGINDLTNASTTLRADNSGWKAEAIAKGWILLKDVTRADDGKNAMKFDLIANPPPVRYIRIRVLHTVTGSGYSNMSELTFWNKQ